MQVSVKTPLQLWREEITPSPLLLFQLDAPNAIAHRADGGWDRKHIRIEVCELCEYWGLNGEQAWPRCHRCGQQVCVDNMGLEWGPPTCQRLLPVKV